MATQDSVRPGKIGCNGYCMGGYFALAAAGYYPERFAAAASFHGSNLATDSPESPHRRAHLMRGEVELYVGVAEIDPYLQPGETVRLRGALEGAAVSHVMELYEGVAHGFTVSSNEQYDEAAAERHWEAMLAFFARTL
jgi:carboxymethylenebutenolidase